jgi:hypothetical protein
VTADGTHKEGDKKALLIEVIKSLWERKKEEKEWRTKESETHSWR